MANRYERDWMSEAKRLARQASLLAGMTCMAAAGGVAWGQSTASDAQVQANVLKALAGAPDLASETITTRTDGGVVTLSGSVASEAARRRAETLASNAGGVQKVVDELQLGSAPAATAGVGVSATDPSQSGQMVLQSDGTYAPRTAADGPAPGSAPAETAQRNNPEADQELDRQAEQANPANAQGAQAGQANGQGNQPPYGQGPYGQPQYGQGPNGQAPYGQPGYGQAGPYGNQSANGQPYPDGGRRPLNGYPANPYPANGYPPQGYAPGNGGGQPPYGAQTGGQAVTIPAGALIRVRINKALSSERSQVGTTFDGVVVNDVVAAGEVAIPRGASVQGTVVEAKSSGALKGRGELSIQLTQVTLAGKSYPIQSDVWAHNGGDKTIETVDKTAGFGAAGALFGALAGGGTGAAIGGGVGAALGLGSSAASGRGQVFIPSEGMVAFHLAAPASVTTVSEQEMQRLAYGVPAGGEPQARPRRVYVYPGYYPEPYYYPYGYAR